MVSTPLLGGTRHTKGAAKDAQIQGEFFLSTVLKQQVVVTSLHDGTSYEDTVSHDGSVQC